MNKLTCIQCKAPLKLTGNIRRCRHLICEYCGVVMDSRNNFKALYSFTHIQNQNSQIRIGMSLKILKVDFTVTGFITYACKGDEWIHFQLYSNTHGYAQLVNKDGLYVFLRRTFYLPDTNVWLLKKEQHFSVHDQRFCITSFYFSEIYNAAGHLIETVKQGKRCKQCFAKSGDQWFHSLYKRNAVENYIGFELLSFG